MSFGMDGSPAVQRQIRPPGTLLHDFTVQGAGFYTASPTDSPTLQVLDYNGLFYDEVAVRSGIASGKPTCVRLDNTGDVPWRTAARSVGWYRMPPAACRTARLGRVNRPIPTSAS
jgi:hypothetical protein